MVLAEVHMFITCIYVILLDVVSRLYFQSVYVYVWSGIIYSVISSC